MIDIDGTVFEVGDKVALASVGPGAEEPWLRRIGREVIVVRQLKNGTVDGYVDVFDPVEAEQFGGFEIWASKPEKFRLRYRANYTANVLTLDAMDGVG